MVRRRDEAPAEEEDQEMEDELVSLQFNEPLSWRAAKPIATGELLRRLEKLSKELVDMDQDTVDKDSLTKVAKELASHNMLAHKEAGVKAYTASCLVDILKLCAPDAPFTPSQLKDIFGLLVKVILPALWDPTNVYNTQHKYVLTSLAEVKSILLINELPNAEDLLLYLFSSFFDGISGASKSTSGEQVAKDVEFHMTDILATLVEEGQTLPPSVLDVIMAQFLRAAPPGGTKNKSDSNGRQTTLLPKEEPEAYVMAKTVCNTCPEKMSRYVSQYFSDVIMDFGKAGQNGHKADDSDEEDAPNGPSDADFKELRKAHQLLRELWRASPTVLQNVIPQVDAELSADNVQLRHLATETLGDMISGIGAAGPPPLPILDPAAYPPVRVIDEPPEHPESSILTTPISPLSFAQTHPQAFNNFVSRKNDKSSLIRAVWTTAVGYIVSTSAGGIGLSREDDSMLVNGLRDKLNDNDEKVRLAAVKAVEAFSFRDIVTKLGASGGADKDGSFLSTLADRCRDKRPPVRVEAMALIGRLWGVATGELASGQEVVATALSGIPSRIFNTFYANDKELNVLLERVIFECLLPLSFPPKKAKSSKSNGNSQTQTQADPSYDPDRIRAERILLLVRGLDEKARRAFFALQGRQTQFAKIMENFVKQCEAYNGGVATDNANLDVSKQNLKKVVVYLCSYFPDTVKTESDLHNFATLNDRRSYNLIKWAVGKENDFDLMYKSIKELNKRIQDTPKPHILDTLVPLLYRSAYIVLSKSHLSTFIDCSKDDKDNLGAAAQLITAEISQQMPDLFKSHIGQLCKDIAEGAPTAKTRNDPGLVETLRACSSYSRKYPDHLDQDKKFTQALIGYVLFGHQPKAAKYAVNILMARKDRKSDTSATDLLQRVIKNWGYDSPHFLNKIAAVCQMTLVAPKITADANDEIVEMALKNVLQNVRTEAKKSDPEWVDDADMDEEVQVKCWALKLLVNRLRGTQDKDEAKEQAPVVFKLLRTLRSESGDLCKTKETPKHHRSRLRLLAGQLTLKLCTFKHFEEIFSHAEFNKLALLAQDRVAHVRHRFIEKLQKYLVNGKLRPRFYTIVFLTAFEPSADFKLQAETWIRSQARSFRDKKQTVMEAVMGRLIALLAHHPDYSVEVNDLVDHARYLLHYVNTVATESNFGMIFRYAERVKQTLDGIAPDKSENLYVLSDLAQAVLRKWQERKNWSFQAYSGRIGLPVGLYTALPSHDAAQEIAEKQFLPEEVDGLLDDLIRSLDKKKSHKRKSTDGGGERQPSAKKARTTQPKPPRSAKSATAKKAATKRAPAKSKKAAARSSSPAPESADRRRSGRAAKRSSAYVEQGSSDEEGEDWDGVAEWGYYDENGDPIPEDSDEEEGERGEENAGAGAEQEGEGSALSDVPDEEADGEEPAAAAAEVEGGVEDAVEEDGKEDGAAAKEDSDVSELSEPKEDETEEQQEEEQQEEEEAAEEEEEEEEAPPPPPKSNGRKGRGAAAKPPAKSSTSSSRGAAAKAKGKAATSTANSKKAKSKPAAAASKAKPPPASSSTRPTRASARGRGKKPADDDVMEED